MKKLLYQLDTDPIPSTFDNVVAYDGGADQVTALGGIDPRNVGALVDGAIFTRAPKDKKFTALFIGGGNMSAGETLLEMIKKRFFAGFRVSVMLDSNGSNTTAAAAVAWMGASASLAGKRCVVLAGTGPVGMRAAYMLAREGAQVGVSSRTVERAQSACRALKERFGVEVAPLEGATAEQRAASIQGAHFVLSTGAAGAQLLKEQDWRESRTLELLSDANATPPAGIEGIDVMDKATVRHGKKVFGAIGFGALKIALHRACIARLFEANDLVLDAEQIYEMAKTMVGKT
ncbi:MAG: methylenetetrahydrofolate dehydrogenase [Burkholderiaceae bacterium]|nr:methylenetetrahydrofolate dehydrogenase [Burkholderiaceae bacterium]